MAGNNFEKVDWDGEYLASETDTQDVWEYRMGTQVIWTKTITYEDDTKQKVISIVRT